MTIGIDIDNTLTNTSIVSNTYVKNDMKFCYANNYRELKSDDGKEFLSKYLDNIVWEVGIKIDALNVLNYWHNLGYKLIFITARGTEKTNNYSNLNSLFLTSLYFINNEVPFDELIFLQENKSNACKKYNIDVFIDDKEKVLDEISALNIKTIRITNDSESKHKIVHNWQEIKELIDGWGN